MTPNVAVFAPKIDIGDSRAGALSVFDGTEVGAGAGVPSVGSITSLGLVCVEEVLVASSVTSSIITLVLLLAGCLGCGFVLENEKGFAAFRFGEGIVRTSSSSASSTVARLCFFVAG